VGATAVHLLTLGSLMGKMFSQFTVNKEHK
jgi:hypothetical protein